MKKILSSLAINPLFATIIICVLNIDKHVQYKFIDLKERKSVAAKSDFSYTFDFLENNHESTETFPSLCILWEKKPGCMSGVLYLQHELLL
jgi:hypothetical protein